MILKKEGVSVRAICMCPLPGLAVHCLHCSIIACARPEEEPATGAGAFIRRWQLKTRLRREAVSQCQSC